MATGVGVDKTLLATLAERMDSEFELSQKMKQSERRFQSWRCGHTLRGHWPLGRITIAIIGSDGRVCVVNVQVGQKELTRSVRKLVPVECDG